MLRVANIIEDGRLACPQRRMVNVARSLPDVISTIILMPVKDSTELASLCEKYGILYKCLPIIRMSKNISSLFFYSVMFPIEVFLISKYLYLNEIDIVHISGGSWQYKGLIASKLTRKKVIWHLNDTSMPFIIRHLFSFFSRYSDGFIFASYRTHKYYNELIPNKKKEFIIPAPVDTKSFASNIQFFEEMQYISQWNNKIVIGTVANISPVKGLNVFIETISILNKIYNNLWFVVVGPVFDSQKTHFEMLQKQKNNFGIENLSFVGQRVDIREFLNRFDIYVCTSYFESSPTSVWEAMALEKPIVSTDVGDVSVHIENNVSGFIAPVGDAELISKFVGMLIKDPLLRRSLGKNARENVCRELDLNIVAGKTAQAYLSL